jgi:hypothetical protein
MRSNATSAATTMVPVISLRSRTPSPTSYARARRCASRYGRRYWPALTSMIRCHNGRCEYRRHSFQW